MDADLLVVAEERCAEAAERVAQRDLPVDALTRGRHHGRGQFVQGEPRLHQRRRRGWEAAVAAEPALGAPCCERAVGIGQVGPQQVAGRDRRDDLATGGHLAARHGIVGKPWTVADCRWRWLEHPRLEAAFEAVERFAARVTHA
jgi:hypothetical protein